MVFTHIIPHLKYKNLLYRLIKTIHIQCIIIIDVAKCYLLCVTAKKKKNYSRIINRNVPCWSTVENMPTVAPADCRMRQYFYFF